MYFYLGTINMSATLSIFNHNISKCRFIILQINFNETETEYVQQRLFIILCLSRIQKQLELNLLEQGRRLGFEPMTSGFETDYLPLSHITLIFVNVYLKIVQPFVQVCKILGKIVQECIGNLIS